MYPKKFSSPHAGARKQTSFCNLSSIKVNFEEDNAIILYFLCFKSLIRPKLIILLKIKFRRVQITGQNAGFSQKFRKKRTFFTPEIGRINLLSHFDLF